MTILTHYQTQSPELFKEHIEFHNPAKEGAIEEKVRDLVVIRASQWHRCTVCLNTFCLRDTSALLPDHFRSVQTSMIEDSPINQ